MQMEKVKRLRGSTWVCTMDVHEVPDLAKLKPNQYNTEKYARLMGRYGAKGHEDRNSGFLDNRAFYLGDLPNLEAVRERFDTGWKEGGERATKLADGLIDIVSQPKSIRRRIRWGDDGDEFDRERLIDGHLDSAWRSTHRQLAVATPIINIVTAWGGNSNRSHDQLFWSGAAAIALVRLLETAGYQTTLTSVCTNDLHSSDKGLIVACRVKQAGEYLRPDAVASTICLGATYRTYLFLAWLAGPWMMPDGLGHHCEVDRLLPHAIDAGMIQAPQIVIPNCFDEMSAKNAVNNALAELQAANLAAIDMRGVTTT